MGRAIIGAQLSRAVSLRPLGIALALQTGGVANSMATANVLVRCTRALLLGTIRSSPSEVAEAGSIVTNTVPSAIVFTLGDLAILSGPAVLASASSVEAVAIVSNAVLALNEAAVTTVVARVTNTAPASALSVTVAIGHAAKADGAGRTTKAIRAKANSITAEPVGASITLLGRAVFAFPSLGAQARGIGLASSVKAAFGGANLGVTLSSRPARFAAANSVLTDSMPAVDAADLSAAVRASKETNTVALAITALSMARAIVRALPLGAITSSIVRGANTFQINALSISRAAIRTLPQ